MLLFTCSSTKSILNKANDNYYIRYIDKEFNTQEFEEFSAFFKSLNVKGDTLVSKNALNELDNLKNLMDKDSLQHLYFDYYFFKDSVRVNNSFASYIYVPSTREKFSSELYLNGKRKYTESNVFEDDKTITKLKVINEKKKKILDLECYFLEITKTQKIGKHETLKRYSIYISDKYNIPINNYDILNLSESFNINGLIMEIKITNNLGHTTNHYMAEDYNLKKLNYSLIDVNALKKL